MIVVQEMNEKNEMKNEMKERWTAQVQWKANQMFK